MFVRCDPAALDSSLRQVPPVLIGHRAERSGPGVRARDRAAIGTSMALPDSLLRTPMEERRVGHDGSGGGLLPREREILVVERLHLPLAGVLLLGVVWHVEPGPGARGPKSQLAGPGGAP